MLPSVGHDPDCGSAELAETLAACFGRKSQKRSAQITGILDTNSQGWKLSFLDNQGGF